MPRFTSLAAIPVFDAHQHFWDIERNYHPWLCDEPAPRLRYGDYTPLRRNYLPADYQRDFAGFDLRGSIHVEAEWNPADPVGETRWIQELARLQGLPTVMVAQARLDRPDTAHVLAAQAAFPFVRGVRHKPTAAASPSLVRLGVVGSMSDPAWRAGYALLAQHQLSFDLQTPWWHLAEAAELARTFPATTLIIDHAAMPDDRSAQGLAGWRHGARSRRQTAEHRREDLRSGSFSGRLGHRRERGAGANHY